MAYASKYYDPVKAHEYYMKHRQLKGGRTNRGSTASLNEQGKAAAAEVKEQITAELKAALAKLPRRGATEARKKLRAEYQEKYYAELDKIRQDPELSKTASKGTGGGTKSAKSTGGSTRAPKESSGSAEKPQTEATKKEAPKKTKVQMATEAMNKITKLASAMGSLSEEQQAEMQKRTTALISKISARLKKQIGKVNENAKKKNMSAAKTAETAATINTLVRKFNAMPEEAKAQMRGKIQALVNRLSSKLGITATKLNA